MASQPRQPPDRWRYLARKQRIVLTQSQNMMTIEWSSEIKEMLSDARHLSERLGHFEIVTLTHVYGVLLSRLQGRNGNGIATILATIDPPWPADSVYLSPGGQTPTLKRAMENAIIRAQGESRAVTNKDIWEALPNGHAETVQHLDRTFGIER